MHSQNVLGELPEISLKKAKQDLRLNVFHAILKSYKKYQKLSIFLKIPIFIDLLPVPWNTSEKQEQNPNKVI